MKHQPLNRPTKFSESHFFEIGTASTSLRLPIEIRKHPSSRRITLRYQPLLHSLMLTIPRYVSIKQGLHFVEEKRKWIEKQIDETVQQFPFENGAVLPILGRLCRIRHVGGRSAVTLVEDELQVGGDPQFLARRVRDWLKEEARRRIGELAHAKAEVIGRRVRGISVRDTTSRWGSCSHSGSLSFSWRLILAPYEVFDYVVSHEVAHLQEFNHSKAFWQTVGRICPEYERWKGWLATNGQTLYAYGTQKNIHEKIPA
jgi:predicted metal-dependent hydrolase